MDELLDTDEPAVGQLDEFSGDVAPYAEYRRLVAEQAAVRRVGTLVARGAEPWEVFDAVTRGNVSVRARGVRRTVAL